MLSILSKKSGPVVMAPTKEPHVLQDQSELASLEKHLKDVNESLYKQNLETSWKNKTLSLLAKLYEISVEALKPEELATAMAEAIQTALNFEFVGIYHCEDAKAELKPLHTALSNRARDVEKSTGTSLSSFVLTEKNGIFVGLHEKKAMQIVNELSNFWPDIPKTTLENFRDVAHMKSLIALPLIIGGEVAGVLALAFNRPFESFSDHEKELVGSTVNVIAVALDKALLYEQLQVSNKKLEKANEQQTILIHFITHQIKGFLTKSRNAFSMMLDGDYGEISPQIKTVAEEGLESGTKGVGTVQDILNAANIKTGKVEYMLTPMDLKPLVEKIFADQKPLAEAKGLKINLTIPEGKYQIAADSAQLEHVLKNLIDNAIKYTPSGDVNVSLQKKDGKVIFAVKDSGVGITPEDKERLFTEGGRGKDSQKINVDSTGFGLFIVKGIVEAHEGKVYAESEGAGKGSTFSVELPAK